MRTFPKLGTAAASIAAATVLLAAAPGAKAQDVAAGRKLAVSVCQACHGLNGLAKMPEMPNIAGDDPAYIVRQLQAYKSGDRQNELMSAVAPMLDDQKMADVAAYYGGLQVQVGGESAPPR